MSTMGEKERFDALMSLADVHFARWRGRAEIEWKVSLALWVLLGGSLSIIKVRPNVIILALFLIAIIALYGWFWTLQIWTRNTNDGEWAFYYISHARNILFPGSLPRNEPAENVTLFQMRDRILSFNNWGIWFQVGATSILAVCVFWFLGSNNPN